MKHRHLIIVIHCYEWLFVSLAFYLGMLIILANEMNCNSYTKIIMKIYMHVFFLKFQITSISRKSDCSESTDHSVQVRYYTFECNISWALLGMVTSFPDVPPL